MKRALSQQNPDMIETAEESLIHLLSHFQRSSGFKAHQSYWSCANSKNELVSRKSSSKAGSLMMSRYSELNRSRSRAGQNQILMTEPIFSTNRFSRGSRGSPMKSLTRMTSMSRISASSKRLRSRSKNKQLQKSLAYDEAALQVLDQYGDELFEIFSAYSSRGEPSNGYKMKSLQFMRLLKDAKLIKKGVNSLNQKARGFNEGNQIWGLKLLEEKNSSEKKREDLFKSKGKFLDPIEIDFIFAKLTG